MKGAAAATQPGVASAATAMLVRGNAIDAVCAGVLVASALDAGVIFGPFHLLVTGPGFGLRCIDARLRQPGRGAPRPRGFLAEDSIPDAARVAVPSMPAGIATALAMFGTATLRRATEAALDVLTRDHPRRALLAAFAREGASAFGKDPVAESILAATGRFAGGTMTRDDLKSVRAPAIACEEHKGLATAPSFDGELAKSSELHAVCAVDRRGAIVAACYEVSREGLNIESLGVVAPLYASPVMRGERRKDPGAPIDCATAIALASTADAFDAAVGLTSARTSSVKHDALEDTLRKLAPSIAVIAGARAARALSY